MPKTLRRRQPDSDVVRLQRLLSANGYFRHAVPPHGIFESITHDEVVLFQLQHLDEEGNYLSADGVVGPKTWWALEHPSGERQRNHFSPPVPDGLTALRQQLLAILYSEHEKPVFEVPDGSNRSPDIDRYWGNTGVIGQPWCCAFVSWAVHELLGRYPVGGRHHLGVQNMWREARQLGMAVSTPRPGDLFVQIFSGGKGHTGFVAGVSPDGRHIYTCEGNCGNRLKMGRRRVDTISHFIDCLADGQGDGFAHVDFDVKNVEGAATR